MSARVQNLRFVSNSLFTISVAILSLTGTGLYGQSAVTIAITSPAGAATVTGTVTVGANATASGGIEGVQVQVDGITLPGSVTVAAPFYTLSWDTTTAADGPHTLTAIATNTVGNTATSTAAITVVNQIAVGQRVQTTGLAGVYAAPSGSATVLGSQSAGALGTIISGPTSVGSTVWWQVNYDNAPSGWTTASLLNPLPYLSLTPDTWISVTPTFTGAPNGGQLYPQGWGNKGTYDPVTHRVIISERWSDPVRGYISIFANGIHAYDPVDNLFTVLKLNNWYAQINPDGGFTTTPLPADTTDPTPPDHHPLTAVEVVPGQNAVYTVNGVNNISLPDPSILNKTWMLNLSSQSWTMVSAATTDPNYPPNNTDSPSGLIYDPKSGNLVYLVPSECGCNGTVTYFFDPSANTWSIAPQDPSALAVYVAGAGVTYDSKRGLIMAYGGNNYINVPTSQLWAYSIAQNKWTVLSNAPVSAMAPAFAYDSTHDVFLALVGNNTYIYNPNTNAWSQLPATLDRPIAMQYWQGVTYDPAYDVFVFEGGQQADYLIALLRYNPNAIPPITIDTTPPTATITAPANGATVTGTVTISATASEVIEPNTTNTVGVIGLQFQLDGADMTGVTSGPGPYSIPWDTTTASNGRHTLTVIAIDEVENTGMASITVIVDNPLGGPVVTGVSATSITASGATIDWTTNTASSSQVAYGLTTAYGSTSALGSALVETHSVILTGLAASTIYHYQVLSTNASGIQTASVDYTFTTGSVVSLPAIQVNMNASEVSGVTGGSTITPSIGPSGFTGTTVVNGTGSINFVAAETGNGAYFLNCCVNSNDAYYKFTGAEVGNIFNMTQGQISFYLQSSYTFAQRQTSAAAPRYAFDARDASNHLYYFLTEVSSGRLIFSYSVGGVVQFYYVPAGTEDVLFGNGVLLNVDVVWNNGLASLYLNGSLVQSTTYTPLAANWTAASNFDIGAYEYLTYGGYYTSDDVIAEFTVVGPTTGGSTGPTVSMTAPSNGASLTATVAVSANASDSAGVTQVQFQLNGANLGSPVTGAGPSYGLSWNTTTVTNGSYTLTAIATDAAGNSTTSSGVVFTVNNPVAPPVISAVSATSIGYSSATIVWTTDQASASQVAYGTTNTYGSTTALNSTLVTSHSVNLSGLAASTTYHYQVVSQNAGGNPSSSGDFTFTTVAQPAGPTPLLQINGSAGEVSAMTNGSVVTPTVAPAGLTGSVVVNGTGSVNYAPAQNGTGVYFLNCCVNTNNAYYKFTGAAVGSIFNPSQGQVSFYLQSRYSFAQRQAIASSPRYAFDVRDGNGHLFYFLTEASSGRLIFSYMVGGVAKFFYVPAGTEDTLFGNGVGLQVTLGWNAGTVTLYLNGTLVTSAAYTAATPNWTAASNFDLGAYEYLTYGGYDISDDVVAEFTVVGPATAASSGPAVSITAPASGALLNGITTVTANATDSAGVTGVQFTVDGTNLGSVVTGTGPVYGTSWNAAAATNGTHTLTAVATDAAGNTAVSSISVTVDTVPPMLSITSPTNGALLNGTVTLTADATDNVGVTQVQFQLDGANLSSPVTGAGPSYSYSWNTMAATNGTHALTAVASDAAGNRATSSVSITVSNAIVLPVISGVTATVTSSGATITWTTDRASSSQVVYGTTSSYGSLSALNSALATSHSVTLTGLAASTAYYYQVQSQTAEGVLAISAGYTFTTVQSGIQPSGVLIVYKINGPDNNNNGVSDSLELAQYYASKRNVPLTNLLGLNISVGSSYSAGQYGTFYSEMVAPIQNALAVLGPTNVSVILLAGELPTTVFDGSNTALSVDGALMGINALGSASNSVIPKGANPYFDPAPGFDISPGHFSHSLNQYNQTTMYLVTRLGSDSSLRGIDQVDQSVYADVYVYPQAGYFFGNAYVNSLYGNASAGYTDAFLSAQSAVQAGLYDNSAEADMNIAYAEHYVLASGFPLKWLNTTSALEIGDPGATFSDGTSASTAPQAMFYGGWYNYNTYNNVYQWLPGSFATDLNSGPYFGMQALDHGASAASYVVSEPFLDGAVRPNIIYYYLLNGYTFAEASALATPYIGWMVVNEGDPLYAPLQAKTPLIDTQAPILSPGYPIIAVNQATGNAIMSLMVNDTPNPEVVTAQVQYGSDTNYGSVATSTGDGPLVEATGVFSRNPTVSLPWALGAVYHYRIVLTDPAGNITTTGDYTNTPSVSMTTPTNGATVSGSVEVSANATDNSGVASIQFTLDGNKLGGSVSGAGPSYSVSWDTTTSTDGSHTLAAIATNSAGNTTTSSSISVTVNNAVVPPVISGISSASITSSGATISWTTDKVSSSQVAYGTTSGYGSLSAFNAAMVTSHSVNLSGLTASTTYHYQAQSQDAQGILGASPDFAFTTAQLGAQPLLQLHADATELSGLTNGSVVTPGTAPAGFTGTVVVNGTGSLNFTPAEAGNGVYFLNCCNNTNNAYYKFPGAAVGSIFNASQGQISFYLQSRYSFAQRQAIASSPRYAFDVRDGNGHLFYFLTEASSGRLIFSYMVGGVAKFFYVPAGTEDTLFGNGVGLQVTLGWNAGTVTLYLNGTLVTSAAYTPATPNWTASSNFDLGAYEYLTYGGYNVSDDVVAEFTVVGPATVASSGPAVSITAPASGALLNGITTVAANATDSAGVTGVQFTVDGTNLGSVVTGTGPVYGTSWNAAAATNGTHTLTAVATDAAGNTALSSISVTVDTVPPMVSITSPTNGALLNGTTTVTANATDNIGVTQVQFQLDGANLGSPVTGAGPSYGLSWNTATATNGSHTLTGTASGAAGNTSTSSGVTVTVNNPVVPPTISAVSATSIGYSSATIVWTTDQASTSQVEYGTTSGYGSTTTLSTTLVTAHTVNLSGLAASTTYHYQVLSQNALGNLNSSADFTFTTVAQPAGPQPVLLINGDAAEVSGVTNGSVVTPTVSPAGFMGSLVVNGTGSVNYTPAQNGNGVYFLNCCVNTDNAYYKFTGAAVGSIFNASQGQISFYLQSRYSFVQRQAIASSPRYAFDVRDGNGHLFYFLTEASSGRLIFSYMVGGVAEFFYVPLGTEDTLFGNGVSLNVTIAWNSGLCNFYLNGVLAQSVGFTPLTASWTANSNFDLGAYEYLTYGGYNISDDIIDEFSVF